MDTQTKKKNKSDTKQKESQHFQTETTNQDSEKKDVKYRSYTLGRRLGLRK